MKFKLTGAEVGSIIVLIIIAILYGISSGMQYREKENRKSAIKLAYSIMESGRLAHISMTNKKDVIFTEQSYFDGNITNRGPFVLMLDKYQNTSMTMWVDGKYCINKIGDMKELEINDNITTEQDCFTKSTSVSELMNRYDLMVDTDKTGLDTNNLFASKKYYAGENPSNYLIFSNHCFRIIHYTEGNDMKVIYDGPSDNQTCRSTVSTGSVGKFVFDEEGSNNWNNKVTLSNLMDIWTLDKNINNIIRNIDTTKLVSATWSIGALTEKDTISLKDMIQMERSSSTDKKLWVGLLNVSDYIKASTNRECLTMNDKSTSQCKENNYLYKNDTPWFMNGSDTSKTNVFTLSKSGAITSVNSSKEHVVRPVLYLNENIVVTGSGRASSPYIVK